MVAYLFSIVVNTPVIVVRDTKVRFLQWEIQVRILDAGLYFWFCSFSFQLILILMSVLKNVKVFNDFH